MGMAGLNLEPHLSKSGKSFLFYSCTSDVIVISRNSQWGESCKKHLKPSSPGIQRFLIKQASAATQYQTETSVLFLQATIQPYRKCHGFSPFLMDGKDAVPPAQPRCCTAAAATISVVWLPV